MSLLTVPEAIESFKRGQMIILVDDQNRENEGDLIIAAQFATPEIINTMIRKGGGIVCAVIEESTSRKLDLPLMVPENTSRHGTNFAVSIDHTDCKTGISAFDRSLTIRAIADPASLARDFRRPGHVLPIVAKEGGTLRRAGHTEGVIDFCRLAGLVPAGALCEIVRDDGQMAQMADLEQLAEELNCGIATIQSLIEYRLQREKLVQLAASTVLPNEYGVWNLHLYESKLSGELHTAMVLGEPEKCDSALVRVHSQCFTGDTLGSMRCDCGPQLLLAQELIAREGAGVLLYLQQEGRGIGLKAKLQAYALQDGGMDTVEANEKLGHVADGREYGIGAQILRDLGIRRMRLLTNNPRKMVGLHAFGLEIVGREPLEVGRNSYNKVYLDTKASKLGHLFGQGKPAVVKEILPDHKDSDQEGPIRSESGE